MKGLRQAHIVWVELERFYVEASQEPAIVVRDGVVLDANEVARKRGVRLGVTLRQVRSYLPECKVKPWEREPYERRQRAWLDLCTEFTGVIEPADQHAAWLDLSQHPNPVDVAERLIRTLAQKTRLRVGYGAAPSKWLACLAARHDDCGLALRDPAAFLARLPVGELLPVAPEHRERLLFLGYYRIGDVAALPLRTLQEQFGEAALTIRSAAAGRLTQLPNALYPPDSIADGFVFDGAVDSSQAVDDACRTLAARIGERLQAKCVQTAKLRLKLERDDGRTERLARTFAKPMRCPRSVLSALRLLIAPALTAPVAALHAWLPDLERTRLTQPTFLNAAIDREQAKSAAAVHELRTVFGDGSVKLGSELALPRRVRVLREWKHATGWR